jgi:hypothetical protein
VETYPRLGWYVWIKDAQVDPDGVVIDVWSDVFLDRSRAAFRKEPVITPGDIERYHYDRRHDEFMFIEGRSVTPGRVPSISLGS